MTAAPVPAWRRRTAGEPRWHVTVVVLVAVALQLALPDRLGVGPRLLLPGLELALLAALVVADPGRMERTHPGLRYGGLVLVGLVTLANAGSAALLVRQLLEARGLSGSAGALLASGSTVYLTNVIAFGLWYWDTDRGGPARRAAGDRQHPDLLFPQMTSPDLAPLHWEPLLVDYLYVSLTNATAFSPTDTLPLTRWVKLLMAVQSAVALATVALVIARSVNILR
ncbi:MAG: hypothetical protein JWN17_1038 [Frankiales bacterium]|nr:hypothetical protein [Frankiales bacterium]